MSESVESSVGAHSSSEFSPQGFAAAELRIIQIIVKTPKEKSLLCPRPATSSRWGGWEQWGRLQPRRRALAYCFHLSCWRVRAFHDDKVTSAYPSCSWHCWAVLALWRAAAEAIGSGEETFCVISCMASTCCNAES